MRYHIIREQIILEIAVGNHGGVHAQHILCLVVSILPAVFLLVGCHGRRHKSHFQHIIPDLWQQVIARLVPDITPPSKVIQSKITYIHFLVVIKSCNAGNAVLQANGHVTDIDDL